MLTITEINEIISLLGPGIDSIHSLKPTTKAWDDDEKYLKLMLGTLKSNAEKYAMKDPVHGGSVSAVAIEEEDKEKLKKLTMELKDLLKYWKSMIKRWDLGNDYNNEKMRNAVELFDKYEENYFQQLEADNKKYQQLLERDSKLQETDLASRPDFLRGQHDQALKQIRDLKEENATLLVTKGELGFVAQILNGPGDKEYKLNTAQRLTKDFVRDPLKKPVSQTDAKSVQTKANGTIKTALDQKQNSLGVPLHGLSTVGLHPMSAAGPTPPTSQFTISS